MLQAKKSQNFYLNLHQVIKYGKEIFKNRIWKGYVDG